MSRSGNRQEIRCRCGKRLLDVTRIVGEVQMEIKCKCGKVVEARVTADETTVKEVREPALV
ncbi:MAG: hypothetical protein JWN15_663 [Firmicutes bacterium]|nr:hypothetical protein [Bacillota bacterium]